MRRAWIFVSATIASGCGYRFSVDEPQLPGGIRYVRAPLLKNYTSDPGAEVIFTEALRQELIRIGAVSGPAADAVLEGELFRIESGPSFPGSPAFRLSATSEIRLVRNGQVLARAGVDGSEEFAVGNVTRWTNRVRSQGVDVLTTDAHRQAALRRLAATLMRQALERLSAQR